jgi:hypothetical protein
MALARTANSNRLRRASSFRSSDGYARTAWPRWLGPIPLMFEVAAGLCGILRGCPLRQRLLLRGW